MNNKPYIKPIVSKIKIGKPVKIVEIDSDILRMFSKQGFLEVFMETLQEARKIDDTTTQEQVFEYLNEKYFNVIGGLRYSSYDAFRRRKDS